MTRPTRYPRFLPLAWALALAAAAHGQANFAEAFDAVGPTQAGQAGPQNPHAGGWQFRNQSNARVATNWRQGTGLADGFQPNGGSGFLACNADWDAGNRSVSAWAILPAVPGLQAGDTVSYFISGWAYDDNRIQLRYSPSGGTNTGSGLNDTGD